MHIHEKLVASAVLALAVVSVGPASSVSASEGSDASLSVPRAGVERSRG